MARLRRDSWGLAYDAFMSYSHALDGVLAPAFHRELERFAKPWYRARAVRIFRDNTNLSATPGLWSSIEQALGNAKWFVLMASPEAAASPWVNREVHWWLDHRPADRLLLVLTGGELRWDSANADFDQAASTAVPHALFGAVREEPRWVDLRWLRNNELVDRSNPRLRDNVADVAATLRGTPKDALIGEHIRQHRRAMRLARSAVTALVALLIGTAVASVIAVFQRNEAVNQARVAQSRQLAALALANLGTHLDQAQLLAVQAYRVDPNPQTKTALFQAVATSPHLVRYLHVGTPVNHIVGSVDGNVVIAGTENGQLIRWDLTRRTQMTLEVGDASITDIATDTHGAKVVASDGEQAVLWDIATSRHGILGSGRAGPVAISPSGKRLAVVRATGDGTNNPGELTVYDGSSSQSIGIASLTYATSKLGLVNDDTVVQISGNGTWQRRSVPNLAVVASSDTPLSPASAGTLAYSADGSYFGFNVFGDGEVFNIGAAPDNSDRTLPVRSAALGGGQEEAFAISADATRMAGASGGMITVATFGSESLPPTLDQLSGNDRVDDLVFVGTRVELPTYYRACEPQLTVSPGGTRAVFVGSDEAVEYRLDGPADPQALTGPGGAADRPAHDFNTVPLWNADGTRLILLGVIAGRAMVWDTEKLSQAIATWPAAFADHEPAVARLSTDGRRIATVTSHGDVMVHSFPDGTVERSFPGDADLNTIGFPPPPEAASISEDLSTAVLIEERGVILVDLTTGLRRVLTERPVIGVLFIHDRLLILPRDSGLETWDTTGTQLLTSASNIRIGLAVSTRERLVVGLRSDSVIVVADLDSGASLGSFPVPTTSGTAAATVFDPDGTHLLVGSAGNRLTRWDMTEDSWIRIACATAGRNLTADEWRQLVGTPPPASLTC